MDSFEFNKIAGAVLGACLGIMVIGKVSNALVHPHMPGKAHIPVKEAAAAKPGAPEAAPAKAPPAEGGDAEAGKTVFNNICKACHTAEQGGKAGQGPNLFGIVGAKHAHMEGFKYSKAMLAKHDIQWTEEELNEFLYHPKVHIKDTAMNYAGIKNNKQRGDVIAYLKTLK